MLLACFVKRVLLPLALRPLFSARILYLRSWSTGGRKLGTPVDRAKPAASLPMLVPSDRMSQRLLLCRLSAINGEDSASDKIGFVRAEKGGGVGDVRWCADATEGDQRHLRLEKGGGHGGEGFGAD